MWNRLHCSYLINVGKSYRSSCSFFVKDMGGEIRQCSGDYRVSKINLTGSYLVQIKIQRQVFSLLRIRASNLFWLGFGDMIPIIRRGKIRVSAEYSLHIQCSWRITLNNKIVIASRDFTLQARNRVKTLRTSIEIC